MPTSSTSGSPKTLYQYVFGISRYSRWLDRTPDEIISECCTEAENQKPSILFQHAKILDDFVGALQDEGLSPGTINNHVKG